MADDQKNSVNPIVRKKGDNAPLAEPPAPQAPEEAAPSPEPAPTEEAAAPAALLGRRVVDMAQYTPPRSKAGGNEGPEPMLQPKSESPTSPETPSARGAQEPKVRVQAGSLEDFEALLAEAGGGAPPRNRAEVGDRVEGTVTTVGDKWSYIDLGGGLEGVARTGDFTDRDGNVNLTAGEVRNFFVLGSSDGTITLGDQLSTREAAMDAIETAAQTGVPLNGRVAEKNKGGFEIDLGGARAFCPISQIELGFTEDPDVHLGRSYQFRVMEVRDARSIVVSRAELLREEQERAAAETLQNVHEGMVVDGTVTRLADFGAFVDIGGVEGLIHVSELGFSRVEHPSEVVHQGDKVRVKVLSIGQTDKGMRIGLSMKETMEDPWETAMANVFAGAKLSGTVSRIEPFGAFIEVAPNVDGLVHVSEMSWEKHVKRPSDIVSVGQVVDVEVLDVDLPRRRISLSLKSASGDPWTNVGESYSPGVEVSGTVENIEDFGAFVDIGGGITALLPRSEMGLAKGATPHSKVSKGDSITARVLSIESARRRMSLTFRAADEVEGSSDAGPRSYADSGSSGLGTFGDLLKDKLK